MSGRLICYGFLLASNVVVATSYAAQQACTTLIAVVQPNAEPYDWLAADALLRQGLSADFLQALAHKTQLTIHHIATKNAEKALRAVRSGRVDLIIGVHREPEADPQLDYLYPAYAQQDYRIWRRAGEQAALQSWPQLAELRGVHALELKHLPDFDIQAQLLAWPIRSVADHATATQQVLAGQADYLIAEYSQQQLYLQATQQFELFEVIEQPVATQDVFVALSKDSACNDQGLRDTVSKALLELAESSAKQGRLTAAMQHWQALHPSESSAKSE